MAEVLTKLIWRYNIDRLILKTTVNAQCAHNSLTNMPQINEITLLKCIYLEKMHKCNSPIGFWAASIAWFFEQRLVITPNFFWEAADDPVAIITFLIKEVMCHPWPTLVAARTLKTNHDVYESRDGRAACFKCWHHVQAYNSNQYSQVIIESLIKIN